MDIFGLVRTLLADGSFQRTLNNPRTQFGTAARRYAGALILPERLTQLNAYKEDQIKYRTNVANATTRYSPVVIKSGVFTGTMNVQLAESDIGSELTSRDYDALRRLLANAGSMDATARLINFADITLNIPLIEWIERARWQAIVGAQVQLRGENEYSEDINYSNPAGHRAAAGGAWSNDAYDPYADIFAMADLLASKGYPIRQIWTSRNVASILGGNAIVQKRTSKVTLTTGGQITATAGRATLAEINGDLNSDGLPVLQTYDLQYRTQTGVGRFLPNDVMVFIGATGEQEQVDLGDVLEPIDDVLGYAAVGVPAGQDTPGRRVLVRPFDDKPPRIEGQAWQTALPVITVPEAIAVIHTIS